MTLRNIFLDKISKCHAYDRKVDQVRVPRVRKEEFGVHCMTELSIQFTFFFKPASQSFILADPKQSSFVQGEIQASDKLYSILRTTVISKVVSRPMMRRQSID